MDIVKIILCLPFLSFLIALVFRKKSSIHISSTILLLGALLSSLLVFTKVWRNSLLYQSYDWFSISASKHFSLSILVDNLSVLLLVIVCLVSTLVHLFSIEYMKEDPNRGKYFSFLGLFTFSMLGIVLSGNLLITFIFWELVGLSSYLLIGFWYQKDSASAASKKAFLVNRIGDIGFLLGLCIIWTYFGTFDIVQLKQLMANLSFQDNHVLLKNGTSIPFSMLAWGGFGICCGAIGKSAQFPLQVWLPDAMEGPTPVSALIHAATMVAAGVFLIARVYFLIPVDALMVMAFLGAITAFMGAFSAFAQHDIKKVLAYSTVSQLGYMIIGLGVGAMDMAIFHLLTHAFFKACLFLSAGAVIHALHKVQHDHHADFDPQDMRIMGGLRKKLPITYYAYLIAMLALAGVPLFSGFLSKDGIITGALAWAEVMSQEHGMAVYIIPALALISALMTAVYMGRQLFLTFWGKSRLSNEAFYDAIRENNWMIVVPISILAILSFGIVFALNPLTGSHVWVIAGLQNFELLSPNEHLLTLILEKSHHFHSMISIVSGSMAVGGIILAYFLFGPKSSIASNYGHRVGKQSIITKLSSEHWFLNQIYDYTFVTLFNLIQRASNWFEHNIIDRLVNGIGVINVVLAQLLGWIDSAIVDGLVNVTAKGSHGLGNMTRSIQGGKLQSYLIWLFAGILFIVLMIII